MITAQDIREKTFERARLGGYEMGEVDDFLEELAADAAASQKEISTLKGKMKVLVDKIEEYRESEDAMRKALVSAQKVAQEIESDAQARADALLAEAQAKADELVSTAQAQADSITGDLSTLRVQEEDRYAAAKEASAAYIEKMLMVCQTQSDFLTKLKDMDMEAAGAVVTPAPAEKKAFPQSVFDEPEPEVEEAGEVEAETEPEPEYVQEFERAVFAGAAYGGIEEAEEIAEDAEEALPEEEEEIDEPTRLFRF